jgi:outer membrane autotransporter protein
MIKNMYLLDYLEVDEMKNYFLGTKTTWFSVVLVAVAFVLFGLYNSEQAGAQPTGAVDIGTPGNSGEPTIVGTGSTAADFVDIDSLLGGGIADPLGGATSGVIMRLDVGNAPTGILIKDDVINYSVLGGTLLKISTYYYGTTSGNKVVVTSSGEVGTVNVGSVYGGLSQGQYLDPDTNDGHSDSVVTGNEVYVSGTVNNNVVGGASNAAGVNITNNTVTISGSANVANDNSGKSGKVIGGSICVPNLSDCDGTSTGSITGNTVNIDGGQVRDAIGAEHFNAATYIDNGDTIAPQVSNNTVNITGGQVEKVSGAYIGNGTANSDTNKVIISGGTITESIYAVTGSEGSAKNNVVKITDGSFSSGIEIVSVELVNGIIDDNEIEISNINFASNTIDIIGGTSNGSNNIDITNNTISLNNVTGSNIIVTGAYTENNGELSGNTINITDSTVSYIYGSVQNTSASVTATLSENIVNLEGANVIHDVYAAIIDHNTNSNASGNIINIKGTDSTVNQIGGDLYAARSVTAGSQSGNDNVINIENGINTVTGKTVAYGTINILDGTNEFGNDVLTNADKNIVISGGDNTFKSNISAQAGKINVTNATVKMDSSVARTVTATEVNVGNNGTFDTGDTDVTVADGDVNFTGNSTLTVGESSGGKLTVADGDLSLSGSSTSTVQGDIIAEAVTFDNAQNSIDGDVTATAGDLVFKGDSINNLSNGTLTASQGISFEGNSANTINTGLTATNDINFSSSLDNTIEGSRTITSTSGNVNVLSNLSLGTSADLTFSSTNLNVDPYATLTLLNDATLNFDSSKSLSLAGDSFLDLDINTLTVSSGGTIEIAPNAIIRVADNGTKNGSIDASAATVSMQPGRIYLDLAAYDPASDFSDPIITGLASLPTGTTFYNVLYDAEIDSSGNLVITGITSKDSALNGLADDLGLPFTRNASQIGKLLDAIAKNGDNPDLTVGVNDFLQEMDLLAITNPAEARVILETVLKQSAGESLLGLTEAIAMTTYKAQGVILGRLDRIYQGDLAIPPAAGFGDSSNRVWVGGFGSWARQKDQNEVDGYDYDAGGVSLGYDRLLASGLRVGVAGTFSTGKLKTNTGLSAIDIDTVAFGLYGSYVFQNDLFLDATASYGHSSNDSEVRMLGPGAVPTGATKTGSFDIDTFLVGARLGKIFTFDNISLTPTIGVRYLRFSQDGWAETINGANYYGIANWFAKRNDSVVEIPLQVKLDGTFQAGQATITPELRLGWTFMAKRPDNELVLGFAGSSLSTTVYGTKPKRNSFQVGAGAKINVSENVDIFVNYDLDLASRYRNHMASGGLGFNF